jgi:hypothetical protein
MVTEAARARRASISATSSGTSSLKGSALNSRDKGTSGLRRPRFVRAAAQIDTAVSRSFRRKPDPWCHAESVFGLVLLTGTSETPSARDLCRTEEVVLPHQRCSSLPRRPLRRVPRQRLPCRLNRAHKPPRASSSAGLISRSLEPVFRSLVPRSRPSACRGPASFAHPVPGVS